MKTQAEWQGRFDGTFLRLTGREDGTLRVTRDLSGCFREPPVSAVCPAPAGTWIHEQNGAEEIFRLPELEVRLSRRSGALSFYTEGGEPLLRERQAQPAELEPAGIRKDGDCVRGRLYFEFREGEGLYGLGSHEEGTGNLRGHDRLLYQHNLKAVVPVLVSTGGWALLFDMGCQMAFHDGADGACLTVDCAEAADWYLLRGDGSYHSLMEKYRSLTGAAPMLPRYVLGFTQSKERYTSAEELEAVVSEYRRRRIPLDLIVQDWMSWQENQWGLKRLDPGRFPRGFADRLHAMHVRVMLSVWPHLQGDRNADLEEMIREGCMLGNRKTYNAFLPKARELYWHQIRDHLLPEGIDAWWCDCTEPFETDWQGKERPSDEERMRLCTGEAKQYLDPSVISLFSFCHARGLYEGLRRDHGEERVLNLTRSSWAGQHRYAAVTWSGDVSASWETLRRHIPEGLNFTASGEPWWSCDAGGFFVAPGTEWFRQGSFPGGVRDPGYRELFVRWMQYACFLTMMRAHGTDTPREIWQFGEEGEPFYDALADCIRERTRLTEIQYALLAETYLRGIPALRVPALVFPEDPKLREIGHEMMLGDQLLICPVVRPMYFRPGGEAIDPPDETVSVYLPKGHCWWTPDGTQVYEGGQTVSVQAPLNRIPVFVRAGAILPLAPVRQYTEEDPDAPIEVIVYPGEDGSFACYRDDGVSYAYEEGQYQRIPMVWKDAEGILTLEVQEGLLRSEWRMNVRRCGGKTVHSIACRGERMVLYLP